MIPVNEQVLLCLRTIQADGLQVRFDYNGKERRGVIVAVEPESKSGPSIQLETVIGEPSSTRRFTVALMSDFKVV